MWVSVGSPLCSRSHPVARRGRPITSPNDNLTLCSLTGQALPSVGLFQNPVAVCARYDPSAQPCEVPDGATTAMSW